MSMQSNISPKYISDIYKKKKPLVVSMIDYSEMLEQLKDLGVSINQDKLQESLQDVKTVE